MGADWYYPEIWYGYTFVSPTTQSYRSFLSSIYPLREFVAAPFQIKSLLGSFHSRMEFDESGGRELDGLATAMIGFQPSNNLEQTLVWAKELADYVQSPIFMGLEFHSEPGFVTGIEWRSEIEDLEESDMSHSTSSFGSSGLSAVSEESDPPTSDSFLSDHDDTFNYHGEEEADTEADTEAEAEAEEPDGLEEKNHQLSEEESL
jgi:hypothetical protein